MSTTQAQNNFPASSPKKAADIKCVHTTKGWVCALCFPLGDPNRALERVLSLDELRDHASRNHYASLSNSEWDVYVSKSVYYEAQFRGQSSLGLDGGVMHGPPTIASQKTLAKKSGVPKRKYVRKTKPTPVPESAFDLIETMINFDGTADDHVMAKAPAFSGGSQDEDSEISDVESAPSTPIPQAGTNPSFDPSISHNQFGMHPMDVSQVAATPNTTQSSTGYYYDPFAYDQYDLNSMDLSQFGAPQSIPSRKKAAPPTTQSRKKAATPKNSLRQRLSENPSFESAISVHGLAQVQASGNAGLQRYLDRQARGLPRTANIPLTAPPAPRNGTMGLPLTAANYAAAGMPSIQVEKTARRTKKVDRRRQASTTLSQIDGAGDNVYIFPNVVPINVSLNQFGVPATIFGQAPGTSYESHTYKSIYAEMTPKEQLPLPELSLHNVSLPEVHLPDLPPGLSLPASPIPEFSHPITSNNVVQQEPIYNQGTIGMFSHGQSTGFTDAFVTDPSFDEAFGSFNGNREVFGAPEPYQYDMGIYDPCDGFDLGPEFSNFDYNLLDAPAPNNTVPQQDNSTFTDFLSSFPKRTQADDIDAMFDFGNSSTPTNNNYNFNLKRTVQTAATAVEPSSSTDSIAPSPVAGNCSPPPTRASSPSLKLFFTPAEEHSPTTSTSSSPVREDSYIYEFPLVESPVTVKSPPTIEPSLFVASNIIEVLKFMQEQKAANETLKKQLAEQKTLYEADVERRDAEAKAQLAREG